MALINLLKGIVQSKIKILQSFTHPHVVPNLYYVVSSLKPKSRYFSLV